MKLGVIRARPPLEGAVSEADWGISRLLAL